MEINEIYRQAAENYKNRELLDNITQDSIRQAAKTLEEYKAGKQALEQRIIENAKTYQKMHWKAKRQGKRQTGGLFQSLVNKHADFTDNKPEATVFARERSDEETAKALNAALPAILERGKWFKSYDETARDKINYGCGITAVLWAPEAEKGAGGIVYRRINPLNIWWDNSVQDLQQSPNVFFGYLVSHEKLAEEYPEVDGIKNLGTPSITVNRFFTNDSIKTADKSYVVDWYYKKCVNGRTVLHYCKFVEDKLLYASENDPEYSERGWYDHGKYPFVFDNFFHEEDSIYGFGLIDANIDEQEEIDELSAVITKNVKQGSTPRYFSRGEGNINLAEYADFDKDFVHVSGGIGEESIRQITPTQLPAHAMNLLEIKKADLKESTFNRDVNAGGSGGTQTAAGIAALQESGSKSSRDAITNTYNAFKEICELTIELIRQFYDETRIFRITGGNNAGEYVEISNAGLKASADKNNFGLQLKSKEPVFDLVVEVSKQNAFSRAAQNQDALNLYNMGFFSPERSVESMAALEVMELDNKDKLKELLTQNSMQYRFIRQTLPQILEALSVYDPPLYAAAMEAAQAAGLIQQAETGYVNSSTGTINAAQNSGQNSYMERQRSIAKARTAPGEA